MNQISVNESVCKKVKQIFYVFIRVIFSQNLFNIILVHGPKKSAKLNKVLSHLSYLNKCQSQFFLPGKWRIARFQSLKNYNLGHFVHAKFNFTCHKIFAGLFREGSSPP